MNSTRTSGLRLSSLLVLLASGPLIAVPTVRETAGKFGDCKLLSTPSGMRVFVTAGGDLHSKSFLADEPLAGFTPAIKASWLAVTTTPDRTQSIALVASFADRRARVYRISPDGTAELAAVLAGVDEKLRIDPTLLRRGDRYFATLTEIDGMVNNQYPLKGGVYTVRLYTSPDLIHWTKGPAVLSMRANLEDGSLFGDEAAGRLYYFCENEPYDKGPSSIILVRSDDEGRTWTEPITVFEDGSDNEPATAWIENGELRFFFSSDRRQPGKSYDGGDAYYARFRLSDYRLLGEQHLAEARSGLLLYSGALNGSDAFLVGLRNFSRDSSLVEARVSLPAASASGR
ncbi:MAG: exo-alpha-sialidase [Pirellulales bacterium]|nr:exo-alpha-sialidase [Pirellulales bacterium]